MASSCVVGLQTMNETSSEVYCSHVKLAFVCSSLKGKKSIIIIQNWKYILKFQLLLNIKRPFYKIILWILTPFTTFNCNSTNVESDFGIAWCDVLLIRWLGHAWTAKPWCTVSSNKQECRMAAEYRVISFLYFICWITYPVALWF